jgi:hypothetical protein
MTHVGSQSHKKKIFKYDSVLILVFTGAMPWFGRLIGRPSPCSQIVVVKVALGQVFLTLLRRSPVKCHSSLLYLLVALIGWTNGRNLGTSQNAMFFHKSNNFGKESTSLSLCFNPLNAELNPICHLLVLLGDLTFMGPCIVSIFQYTCISNKM